MGCGVAGIDKFGSVLGTIAGAAAKAVNYIRDNWGTIGPIVSIAGTVALLPLTALLSAFRTVASAVGAAIAAIKRFNATPVVPKNVRGIVGTSPDWVTNARPGVYASGGIVRGSGPVPITAHGGERVLSNQQTALFERMVYALEGGGGRGLTLNQYITGSRAEGEQAANAAHSRLAAMMVTI